MMHDTPAAAAGTWDHVTAETTAGEHVSADAVASEAASSGPVPQAQRAMSGPYDGVCAFPDVDAPPRPRADRTLQIAVTWLLVAAPFAGLVVAAALFWGHGLGPRDAALEAR
jgi:hypothetical protein